MLPIGARFARYRIERLLGRGGMATVYGARHELLGTAHALKVLSSTHPASKARLVREGRVQAHFDPGYIVPVTDVLEDMGSMALLMPLVEGCSLREMCAEHTATDGEVATLMRHIASAMAHAHAKEVVHRDLKPANILLDLHRGQVRARVADFGVARELGASTAHEAGMFVGTRLYASPEQLKRAHEAGAPSDLWSLGLVLLDLVAPGGVTVERMGRLHMGAAGGLDGVRVPWNDLAGQLLQVDPTNRIAGASHVVEWIDACGVQPDPMDLRSPIAAVLTRLQARPREALPDPVGSTASGVHPVASTSASRLATPSRDAFVGRKDLLSELGETLGTPGLVSVVGAGGTGKSRLLEELLQHHPTEAWRCDLSAATDGPTVVSAIAQGLGLPLRDTEPEAQILNLLTAYPGSVVVLDNVDSAIDPITPLLDRWLDKVGAVTFVATSRQVLGVRGERVVDLPPLPASEARALFVARATAVKRGFSPTADDDHAIDQIVAMLDHLPLAIELAAARVRVLPPQKLLARMGDRFRMLKAGNVDTMRASIAASWEPLDPHEQHCLSQLAVFEGPVDFEAIEAVVDIPDDAPWVLDIVQSLVDKSLVQASDDGRFRMLSLIRAFAAEHATDLDGTRARHAAYWATFGSMDALDALHRHGGVERIEALTATLADLRAASQWSIASGPTDTALQVARATWAVLSLVGPFSQGAELLTALTSRTDLSPEHRAYAGLDLGDALLKQGRLDAAIETLTAAVTTLDGVDVRVATQARVLLGSCLQATDQFSAAIEALERALAGARASQDRRLEGLALLHLANVERQRGQAGHARAHYEEALRAMREVGDTSRQAPIHGNLGDLANNSGHGQEARDHLEEAQRLHAHVGNRNGEAYALGYLARLHQNQGRLPEAIEHYEQALERYRDLGNRRMHGVTQGLLATAQMQLGAIDTARANYRAALAIHQELGHRRAEAQTLGNLGLLEADLGNVEAALTHYDTALAIHEDRQDPRSVALVRTNRALLLRDRGDLAQAEHDLTAAAAAFRAIGNPRLEGYASGVLGDIRRRSGDLEGAAASLDAGEALLRSVGDAPELMELTGYRIELELERGNPEEAARHWASLQARSQETEGGLPATRMDELAERLGR